MKRFIFIVLLMSYSMTGGFCSNKMASDPEENRKVIILTDRNMIQGMEFDRNSNEIEAVIDFSSKTIEIDAFGIGIIDIYVINSRNQIIDCITVDTDTDPIIYLDCPEQNGKYTLAIWGKSIWEGTFEI